MQNNHLNSNAVISTNFFAGIDHLSLDKRTFTPSPKDIERLCRFFSIGKLKHYQKERDIVVSHSNFFVFVETDRGQYAVKYYPKYAAKIITIEHAVNRFLIGHHFPTPIMYADRDRKPFLASNNRLATCFSYIDGQQAWQQIKQRNIMIQINTTMFSLKKILAMTQGHIRFIKQKNLATTINALAKESRALSPYSQKKLISASLKNAYRTYQRYPSLFTRQLIHNNASLTNFLISKETVYTLDLSHIWEDYAFSDLASLIVSCLFLKIPKKTVKALLKDYFVQHKMSQEHTPALTTLVQVKLIEEYLKNVCRGKAVDFSAYPADLVYAYRSQLLARMQSIAASLRPEAPNHLA